MVKAYNNMNKLTIVFLLCTQVALAQRAIPPLWGHRVHDEANVLSHQAIEELELTLKKHQDSTGNQIAVLIIPSLDGDNLEDYALRVAHDEWKLGEKGRDNGVLLLVVINDRKIRIEVGEGLEGPLPDAISNRIIRHDMAPFFREHNYEEGIKTAVTNIIRAIAYEYQAQDDDGFDPGLSTMDKLVVGLFLTVILGVFSFFALVTPGCGGWGLYAFLIPFYAIFPWIILGTTGGLSLLAAYVLGMPVLKGIIGRTAWGKRIADSMANKTSGSGSGWSSGSGWYGGGSGGGGGWSSGGGGFSGGGGSFGGGGSSGSW
jgi:uncharacterized protein